MEDYVAAPHLESGLNFACMESCVQKSETMFDTVSVFGWMGISLRTAAYPLLLYQWKAPGDNSPFLARRFDNGVFKITIQDGPKRKTFATAQGNPDLMEEFQSLVAEMAVAIT